MPATRVRARRNNTPAPEPAPAAQWEAIASIERTQERVVTVLDTISQRLTNLEAGARDAPSTRAVEKTERRVDDIEDRLLQAAKPNYQAMGFLLAAILPLGALVAYGINSKVDGYEDKVSTQLQALTLNTDNRFDQMGQQIANEVDQLNQHMSDGHPGRVEQLATSNKETLENQLANSRREFDALQQRLDRMQSRMTDEIISLQKRTGTLFKEGQPY